MLSHPFPKNHMRMQGFWPIPACSEAFADRRPCRSLPLPARYTGRMRMNARGSIAAPHPGGASAVWRAIQQSRPSPAGKDPELPRQMRPPATAQTGVRPHPRPPQARQLRHTPQAFRTARPAKTHCPLRPKCASPQAPPCTAASRPFLKRAHSLNDALILLPDPLTGLFIFRRSAPAQSVRQRAAGVVKTRQPQPAA